MPNLSRLAQFGAFSPLKGYENLILEQQRHKDEKLILSPDQLSDLDYFLQELKPGTKVLVKYYNFDYYETLEDYFQEINPLQRTIVFRSKEIPLVDIAHLELCNV